MIIKILIVIFVIFLIKKIALKAIKFLLILFLAWMTIGFILKSCDSNEPVQVASDMQMAETFIKDNPKLCKRAKIKVLTDGTVRIITKRAKFNLKDGVLMTAK